MRLVSELRRRNVLRMAALYVVAAWLIVQVAGVLIDLAKLPDWIGTTILWLLAVGFPISLIFSWFYEITPDGISLEKDVDPTISITHVTGRRLDFIVISMLCAAIILFAYDKWWTAAPARQSIAVLPFVNMSDDPNNEYFSDGISEEILNLLAKIPELQVTSRSSAFSFKGQNLDVPTMAAKLNVAHVLEGSVRKSGNQLRITTQLIEVDTDMHLWSETYERELKSVFAIQDEIAEAVVNALKVNLLGETPRVPKTTPEAYALYLQSKALANQGAATGFLQAEAVMRRVLEIDSTYVPAWVQLADIYFVGSASSAWQPHEGTAKSRAAVMEALRLDPDSAQAHAWLSIIAATYDYDPETARKELELASTLGPHDPVVLRSAAWMALRNGDYAEAIRLFKELEIIDPISLGPKMSLGKSFIRMGRLAEAKSAFAEVIELRPEGISVNFLLGSVMLVSGDLDDALLQMNKERREGLRLTGRAMVLHAMGDTSSAATEFENLIVLGDRFTYEIAQVHAYFGNLDESFRWLHRAIDRRDHSLNTIMGDPFLDNLLDDPRFDAVLERLGRKVH